jgi:hypothetical protein
MDMFLNDMNEVRFPPEEVRLRELQATPKLDGSRVKIFLELTPFMKRPNVEVTITASSGKEVAHISILETMLRKLEFTMHLRETKPGNEYIIDCIVYYQRLPEPSDDPMDVPLPDPMIVDHQKVTFILPESDT